MKKIALLPLFLVWGFDISAQAAAKIDSTYNRPYYEQKRTLYQLLPKVKNAVVFIGNSITDGNEWTELLGCKKCLNRGISGDISFGINARLSDILVDKPKKIFLLIGINDISRGIPNDIIIANYKTFVSRTKTASPKTQIYLQSVLPANNTFRKFVDKNEESIKILNAAMLDIAQNTEGVAYIDLYSKFLDTEGRLDKKYTNDGLHLLGEGYLLWSKILKQGKYLK
jgi:lysophospholipase L1-like esterase